MKILKNNIKKIPKLRFPGFSSEWEKKKIEKIGIVNPLQKELPEEFVYIDLESVKKGVLKQENKINKINSPSRAQRVLQKEDILFQTVRPYQQNNFYFNLTGDYVASTGYAQIRTEQNPMFIYQYLHTQQFLDNVLARSTGSSYPAINSNDFKKIKINIPVMPEQEKIAEFLRSADEWIENLNIQKEFFENYKKGMMQKIFSREVRFKDENGKTFSKWEEEKLGDIVDNHSGTSLEEYVVREGSHKFISIGNYSKDGRYQDDTKRIALNDITQKKLLNKSDLVMVLNDKTVAGDIIGSTILIDKNDTYIYNQRSERLVVNHNKINSLFLWFLLNAKFFRRTVVKIAQGGTQIYVNFSAIRKIKISLPSFAEQQKIVKFLISIDNLIESKQQQIIQAKQWKEGLMQGLFV